MKKTFQAFNDENGNLKVLPKEFFYQSIIFEKYYYNEKENRIYTRVDNGFSIDDNICTVKINSLDLLSSIINLINEFEDNLFTSPQKLLLIDRLTDRHKVDKIIKWCVKNGYPFTDRLNNVDSNNDSKLVKLNLKKYYGFDLKELLVNLNDVYCLYNICLVLIGIEENIKNPSYISTTNSYPKDISDYKNINNLTTLEYKNIFEEKYNNLSLKGAITFEDTDSPYIRLIASNIFEAVTYQIALMLYNPVKEIRFCKRCHKPFEINTRNQRYCHHPCTPQNAYAERKRREKQQKNKPEN